MTAEEMPAPEAGRVAAVVVTHNSEAVLGGCLAALDRALAGVSHQIVVVDNVSTDATVRMARAVPGVTVVVSPSNGGYAAGVNAGAAAAGPFGALLVLNPDTRLQPGSVGKLLDALQAPSVGITVPRMLDGEGRLQLSLRREPTIGRALGEALLGGRAGRFAPLGEVVTEPERYRRPGTAAWATGAVMLISRRCLDAVGPWDESFFLYWEETDFALRARDAGFSLRYVPDAVAVHLGGELGRSAVLWRLNAVNRVRLYRRRHRRAAAAAFRAAVVLNEVLRAPRHPKHRAALRALVSPDLGGPPLP